MPFSLDALRIISWKCYAQQPRWDRFVQEDLLTPATAYHGRPPDCVTCTEKGICCRQLVPIVLYESLAMAHYLLLSGKVKTGTVPHLRGLGERQRASTCNRWIDEHEPCSMQDPKSGLCTVYAARPGSCRMAYTWDAPDGCRGSCIGNVDEVAPEELRLTPSVIGASIDLQKQWGLSDLDEPFWATLPDGVATALLALSAKTDTEALDALRTGPWFSRDDFKRLFSDLTVTYKGDDGTERSTRMRSIPEITP